MTIPQLPRVYLATCFHLIIFIVSFRQSHRQDFNTDIQFAMHSITSLKRCRDPATGVAKEN
jgi:hypothetical protein